MSPIWIECQDCEGTGFKGRSREADNWVSPKYTGSCPLCMGSGGWFVSEKHADQPPASRKEQG